MNDKELLLWAAKAANIDDRVLAYDNDGTAGYWNPIDDDGDCFRLLVLLRIELNFCIPNFSCGSDEDGWTDSVPFFNLDENAIIRREIVKKAASMGMGMP